MIYFVGLRCRLTQPTDINSLRPLRLERFIIPKKIGTVYTIPINFLLFKTLTVEEQTVTYQVQQCTQQQFAGTLHHQWFLFQSTNQPNGL
jgi:hypothetical protein